MVTVEINTDVIIAIVEVVISFTCLILFLMYKNAEADVEYYQTILEHEQTTNKMLRKRIEELEKEEGITDDE